MRYQEVEIAKENGEVIAITGERKIAFQIIAEKGLTPIQEMLVPLFDDEGECTGENILIITVQ